MLPEVLGAPENLPLEPVEHMSFAIYSVIPSGVRCASARRLISQFMARWTLEKPNFDGGLLAQRTSFAPAARAGPEIGLHFLAFAEKGSKRFVPALKRQVSRGATRGEKWFAVLWACCIPRVRIVRQEELADSLMAHVCRNRQRGVA